MSWLSTETWRERTRAAHGLTAFSILFLTHGGEDKWRCALTHTVGTTAGASGALNTD